MESSLKHEVFNIGGGPNNTLSLLELLNLLEKLIGRIPKVNYSNWRPADQKVYISDISKAEKLLRWRAKVSPEEGLRRLVNWVSKNVALFNGGYKV